MKYKTILCEDNAVIRGILAFILQERGHEVFSYENARDCPLSYYSECKCNYKYACIDIIIADVTMPKANGLAFIEKLKKNGCSVRNIALVSASWTEEDIAKAQGLGCVVFHKPVAPEELFAWIETCEKVILTVE